MREHLNSFCKLEFDKVKRYIQRYALSGLGREHIETLHPSSDQKTIEYNLALVSEMKRLIETDDPLPLGSFPDVRMSLQRAGIENYMLSAEELRDIARIFESAALVSAYFQRRKDLFPLLANESSGIRIEKLIVYNIKQAIDDDGTIKDSASKELQSIRRQIFETSEKLKRSLQSILKSVAGKEWVQDEIITTREGRMVIPIKVEHKREVPGFIHSSSSSGATVFVEPTETLDLNNSLRTLQFEEQREVEKILKELTKQVREVSGDLINNCRILGHLDFVQAKAKHSIEVLGSAPRIGEHNVVRIVGGYHPILLERHPKRDVVPLNLELGSRADTLVITGPNAGGKSVAMKTVGLLTLLAQSGCHIPAAPETELRVFTDVFVDVGDEQSIENDLSSFSSHLANLKSILQEANQSSLVLIDEIASGTDPAEGSSIAAAVLEHLTQIGCATIVTTHQGALKAFAFENSRIDNGAMEFDQATLQPTYRFRNGIPGSSYAIEMAERLQFPQTLIRRARDFKGNEANKLENLILDLERQSQELRTTLDRANADRDELRRLTQEYEVRVRSLEKEVKAIKNRALDEAKGIIQKANAAIESAVRDIREKSAERPAVKAAHEQIAETRETLQQLQKELGNTPSEIVEFEVGDTVQIMESNSIGEIIAQLDGDNFTVLAGDLKLKVHRSNLLPAGIAQPTEPRRVPTVKVNTSEVDREIDLRGMNGDDAIAAVEKFLDQAILTGLNRIDIIHGKGTGALRKRITTYLKGNPVIKSFRLGEWNEGGAGVTVVELQ
jgi:DNA mismatch repair protein MutS2